jgi:hypothetical protein
VVKDQAFHRLTVRGGVSPHFLAGCRDICGWREHKTGAKRGESPRWTGFDPQDEANANLIAAALSVARSPRESNLPALRHANRLFGLIAGHCFDH